MKIHVEAWARRFHTHQREKVTDAHFTFVAIDESGRRGPCRRSAKALHSLRRLRHGRADPAIASATLRDEGRRKAARLILRRRSLDGRVKPGHDGMD